jgi:hypothetical protein
VFPLHSRDIKSDNNSQVLKDENQTLKVLKLEEDEEIYQQAAAGHKKQ